jgi:hypothetical protein
MFAFPPFFLIKPPIYLAFSNMGRVEFLRYSIYFFL